ncbi:hypothetical protein [Paractinoplanes rishiriensis]|uniref:hypothetical protein n=1 Tax=Paractinoplanes rishiriensis TaxID=1050105 RepID=UPI00194452DA|nr:hypothetical protein [Actinoplanes rishiriensis]
MVIAAMLTAAVLNATAAPIRRLLLIKTLQWAGQIFRPPDQRPGRTDTMGSGAIRVAFDARFGHIYSFLYKMFRPCSAEKLMLEDRATVDPRMGHD